MKGWKTWVAGIGTILTGVGQLAMALSGQGDVDFNSAITTITAGLAIIGIGHKIEKTGGGSGR